METTLTKTTHGWTTISFSFASWIECLCGFRPESQDDMDAHIPASDTQESNSMSAPKPRPTTLKTIEAKKRAEEVAGLNAVGDANLGDVIESALVEELSAGMLGTITADDLRELGHAIHGTAPSEQENRKRYGDIIDGKKQPKKDYVRPEHLMDRPFRGNEGLLALKAQLEADAPKSNRRR